jgi:glycosyltransferase involved in cell wall biosynthesis
LKRILIISYFFPPCNLTASQRVNSWAKYLHKSGFYPIIVTRKWEKHVTSFDDCHYPTSKEVLIENHDHYEVHYCPYSSNLRDKLHVQKKLYYFKKFLSLIEIIFQNIWVKICPFNNFIAEAEKIIKSEKNIHSIIISGNPFIQFKFGYKLNKKHKIPWIADYRDAWTTSTINNISGNKIFNLINSYHKFFEKKWTKTASYITASSAPIGNSVSKITNVPSSPIFNGFEPSDFQDHELINKNKNLFQVAYIGTLYAGQDISIFIEAFKKFIDKTKASTKIMFPGLDLDEIQKNRIEKLMMGYENFYETSSRIPKSEILKIEKSSHLLLHVAWKKHEGIIASKIYEYIGSGTKTIIVPGDNGSIDEIVKQSNSGVVFHDLQTTFDFLCEEYDKFKHNKIDAPSLNRSSQQFTRENQALELAKLINNVLK